MTSNEVLNRLMMTFRSYDYKFASALEKREALWAAVKETTYEIMPAIEFSLLQSLIRTANLALLAGPFSTDEDVRPPRSKMFHTFGVVAKAELVPSGQQQFTGIFESGGVAIVRLSLEMDERLYVPGVAVKVLVDGYPSENFVVVPSLDPTTNRNYFRQQLTNVLATPAHPPFGPFWVIASFWISLVAPPLVQPLDHLAAVTSSGQRVADPRTPAQLFLRAPKELHQHPDTTDDFRDSVRTIPPGTLIYKVFGTVALDDSEEIYIGDLRTESEFIASAFGDRVLSIHHRRPATGDHGRPLNNWSRILLTALIPVLVLKAIKYFVARRRKRAPSE